MKYVLVTGAFGGMGKATVAALRRQGYGVFALDKRIEAQEEGVYPIEADITDEKAVLAALSAVREKTESLYAILHLAGIYLLDSLVEMPRDSFERIFRINLHGAFLINKTFFPLLGKGSRILLVTSELAPLDPLPFTGVYAVTKAALDRYAYSLRIELLLLDISVSVLRAGAVDTDMIGASTDALDRFCESTTVYALGADRFRRIVNGVEARRIPSATLAARLCAILKKKKPRFAYAINRNPLLLLLNALPQRIQLWVIRKILK